MKTPENAVGAPAAPALDVATERLRGLPVFSLRAFVRGGQRAQQAPGQAYLTSRMLIEGTTGRDWRELALECDQRGATIEPYSGGAAHGVAVDALADDWEWAIDRVAEMLLEPTFPCERFEWVREQTTTEMRGLADRPEVRASWEQLEQIYRPHPFSTPAQGLPGQLFELEAEACAGWHRETLTYGLGVAAAGDLDPERVRRRLEERFAPPGDASAGPQPAPPRGGERRRVLDVPGEDQAHLFVGRLTVTRRDPDLPTLEVLGVVLGAGDGLEGRLPARLREREGLAYSVGVEVAAGAGLDPGRLTIYAGTSVDRVADLERALDEELQQLREEGVSTDELEAARSYLVGSDPFRRETARQRCDLLAAKLLFGQPYDSPNWAQRRWRRVTRDDVLRVARTHLAADGMKVTLGQPELNRGRR